MQQHHQLSLQSVVHTAEDSIITLSGPALAISGIIAGVDLVTGGHAMQSMPGLTLAWAICLLLTLDFQVLALGARTHQVYNNPAIAWQRKALEISLAVLVAAAISYVSIQMQSIIARMNGEAGLSIDTAAAQLGISSLALIWERSALVLVLIFLSGWFRGEQKPAPVQALPTHAQPQQSQSQTSITPEISALVEQIITRVTITMQQQQLQQSGQLPVITAAQLSQLSAPVPGAINRDGKQPEKVGIVELIEEAISEDQASRLEMAYQRLLSSRVGEEVSANLLRQEAGVRAEVVGPWLRARLAESEPNRQSTSEG